MVSYAFGLLGVQMHMHVYRGGHTHSGPAKWKAVLDACAGVDFQNPTETSKHPTKPYAKAPINEMSLGRERHHMLFLAGSLSGMRE